MTGGVVPADSIGDNIPCLAVLQEDITRALIQEMICTWQQTCLFQNVCSGANNLKLNTVNSCQFLIFKELKKSVNSLALVGSYLLNRKESHLNLF